LSLDRKNWHRWGDDDERGLLNLVTHDKTRAATALARSGRVFPLAIPLAAELSSPVRGQFDHEIVVRHDAGARRRAVVGGSISTDLHNFTHIDALGHIGYDGAYFNGVPITDEAPAGRGTIDHIGAIVTRAVVADVAALLGVDHLEAGFVIDPDHLDACLESSTTEVGPGDVLLVRTGWINEYLQRPADGGNGWPGLGLDCLDWLATRDVVAVGADTIGVEVVPPEDPDGYLALHEVLIRDMGMYLLEFLTLEECCRAGVTEGMFVAAPLPVQGGFGSPITPVLIA
jgi:kynurenine formamidase